jgi:oligopeptide transport system substrate-binding protein
MKYRRLFAVIVFLTFCTSMLLTGCKPANEVEQEITVNIVDDPARLDPQAASDPSAMLVLNAISEGLCRKDANGVPMPGVAKDWDISEDGLTYTFNMRRAEWADGSAVSAEDFRFAWLRALNPAPYYPNISQSAFLLFCIKGAQDYAQGKGKAEGVAVEVKGGNKLVVALNKPTPEFLDLVCNTVFLPMKKEFYDRQCFSASKMTKYGTTPQTILGNGPFTIKEWNHGQNLILEKNSKYWNRGKIRLNKVVLVLAPNDHPDLVKAFKADKLDVSGVFGSQSEECVKQGIPVESYYNGMTAYIGFNAEDPLLKNTNIRKALAYALNREKLVTDVFKEGSEKALGFVNPDIFGYMDFFRKENGDMINDGDVDTAKKFLEAGMKELNITDIPKFKLLVEEGSVGKRDAEAYVDSWKSALGIETEIETLPYNQMSDKVVSHDFKAALLVWSSEYNDPEGFLRIFESGSPMNFGSYSNPDYDELLAKAGSEKDRSKRMDLLSEAEKLLLDEMALCPAYFVKNDYIISKHVKGVVRRSNPMQDIDLYWTYVE